jgi:transketolase
VTTNDRDTTCVNTIRTLCIDAVQHARSGHPGTPMAMAPVVLERWQNYVGDGGRVIGMTTFGLPA